MFNVPDARFDYYFNYYKNKMKTTILLSSSIIAGSLYINKEPRIISTTKVVEVPKIIEVPTVIEVPKIIKESFYPQRETAPLLPMLVKPNVRHTSKYDWDYELLTGVKYFEGYIPNTYKCSGGVQTIGYGCTDKRVIAMGAITESRASSLLKEDLEEVREQVDKIVTVDLTEYQRNALISFTFNCGPSNLKQLVNGVNRLNDGNYKSIERLLPQYRIAGGKVRKGLEKRRAWELSLWRGAPQIN